MQSLMWGKMHILIVRWHCCCDLASAGEEGRLSDIRCHQAASSRGHPRRISDTAAGILVPPGGVKRGCGRPRCILTKQACNWGFIFFSLFQFIPAWIEKVVTVNLKLCFSLMQNLMYSDPEGLLVC